MSSYCNPKAKVEVPAKFGRCMSLQKLGRFPALYIDRLKIPLAMALKLLLADKISNSKKVNHRRFFF